MSLIAPPLIVKVCGVRDAASAQACAQHGATWAGLNCVPDRRRYVDPATARALIPALGDCKAVGVFLDQSEAEIARVADALGLWGVQIHGAVTPAACARLQARGHTVIRAVGVDDDFDAATLAPFEDHVDAFLVDGREPGAGHRINLNRIKHLQTHRPVILAGGLHAGNVADAIAEARPAGVDCASGIETDGRPDPARIAAFLQAARPARAKIESTP